MSEDLPSWTKERNIFSVEKNGKTMFFRFTAATETEPSKSPTMMLLHGHGSTNPSRFRDPKWNAIAPVDNFGVDGLGSWWIGEHGDLTTIELLDEVIKKSCQMMDCNEINKLFIYGSSMGGFGALLHGHRYNAIAVYANVPQIQLLGTTYSEGGMKKFFSGVIAKENNHYNDLANLLNSSDLKHPLYFMCENRFGYRNYRKEHINRFLDVLEGLELNYHLEIIPTKGHNKNRGINEVKAMFELYCLNQSQ
jgi:hypothetical protein